MRDDVDTLRHVAQMLRKRRGGDFHRPQGNRFRLVLSISLCGLAGEWNNSQACQDQAVGRDFHGLMPLDKSDFADIFMFFESIDKLMNCKDTITCPRQSSDIGSSIIPIIPDT